MDVIYAMANAKILEKGLRLLEELAESADGLTAVELAERIGVHKTSVYRYINSLLDMGYIQNDNDSRYHLGNKILELGSQKLRRMPLRETAHPFLIKLNEETQKTVHLCVLDRQDVVYIDKIESHRTLPIMSRIGSRAPAYCTGVGKALLSGLPTDQVVSLLREMTLERRTPNTITDPMKLLEEIKLTAERGYAIDNGEHEAGIKCLAAPVRGYGGDVIGAISITGLKREFDDLGSVKELENGIKRVANDVSKALGYTT
ncbi:MAG: IclR family transcriptional regulator [candidate division WOR-3 bacterium]|nr:IclR family transcriptional regulator [candidate division WOR-3 bacterium]